MDNRQVLRHTHNASDSTFLPETIPEDGLHAFESYDHESGG